MANLTRLRQEVAEMKTAQESARALIEGLAAKIREAVDDQAALEALADELDASTNALASAVAENTPGEVPVTEE